MIDAKDAAKFFLALSEPEEGDALSNLKLQKLLYYAQGFALAMWDRPLFPEPIVAWTHGPVVPTVYHEYKTYGGHDIPRVNDLETEDFDPMVQSLLMDVYRAYGQFSAWKLRDMTHDEPPWKNTDVNAVISHDAMRDYFRTQIED